MKDSFNIAFAIVISVFIIAITTGTTVAVVKQAETELEFVKAGLEQCNDNTYLSSKILWVKDCVAYKNSKKD